MFMCVFFSFVCFYLFYFFKQKLVLILVLTFVSVANNCLDENVHMTIDVRTGIDYVRVSADDCLIAGVNIAANVTADLSFKILVHGGALEAVGAFLDVGDGVAVVVGVGDCADVVGYGRVIL